MNKHALQECCSINELRILVGWLVGVRLDCRRIGPATLSVLEADSVDPRNSPGTGFKQHVVQWLLLMEFQMMEGEKVCGSRTENVIKGAFDIPQLLLLITSHHLHLPSQHRKPQRRTDYSRVTNSLSINL